MKKNILNLLLILVSAFVFTSCGDSKEAVIEDAISLMKEDIEAKIKGDENSNDALVEKKKKILERAKALDLDMNNLPDDLQAKMDAGIKEIQAIIAGKSKKDINAVAQ